MRIRTVKAVAAVMVSVVLATAACGTTDDEGSADTTTTAGGEETTTTAEETTTTEEETTTTEEETTTTSEPDDDDAEARAEAALITAEDFPADFESTPSTDGTDTEIFDECAPEVDVTEETVAEASSDDFTTGDLGANEGTQYSADSAVLSSEDVATEIVDLFGDDAFAACASEGVKEELDLAATGELEAVGDLAVGDQAAGLQGAFTVTDPETNEDVVLDVAVAAIRTGDLVTILGGIGVGQILDSDLIAELADTIAERQEG